LLIVFQRVPSHLSSLLIVFQRVPSHHSSFKLCTVFVYILKMCTSYYGLI
jgi:hypothetical protein